MPADPPHLRRATIADAPVVAEIDLAARAAALSGVRWAHDADEMRAWITGKLLVTGEVWVAEADGVVLGYVGLQDDTVGQLYLRPGHWRQGVGRQLIALAKRLRPAGLRLWCFQRNARGRAFYQAQGFAAVRFTDGADNEEHEPDMLFVWPGSTEKTYG